MRDCRTLTFDYRSKSCADQTRFSRFCRVVRSRAHIHTTHTQCQMVIDLRPSTIRSISPARGRPAFTNPCQSWETTAMEAIIRTPLCGARASLPFRKPSVYTRRMRLACTRMCNIGDMGHCESFTNLIASAYVRSER